VCGVCSVCVCGVCIVCVFVCECVLYGVRCVCGV